MSIYKWYVDIECLIIVMLIQAWCINIKWYVDKIECLTLRVLLLDRCVNIE